MFKLIVNAERCKACGLCVETCPQKILTFSEHFNRLGYHYLEVTDEAKCAGCRRCVLLCPDVVIEMYETQNGNGEQPAGPDKTPVEQPVSRPPAKEEK